MLSSLSDFITPCIIFFVDKNKLAKRIIIIIIINYPGVLSLFLSLLSLSSPFAVFQPFAISKNEFACVHVLSLYTYVFARAFHIRHHLDVSRTLFLPRESNLSVCIVCTLTLYNWRPENETVLWFVWAANKMAKSVSLICGHWGERERGQRQQNSPFRKKVWSRKSFHCEPQDASSCEQASLSLFVELLDLTRP